MYKLFNEATDIFGKPLKLVNGTYQPDNSPQTVTEKVVAAVKPVVDKAKLTASEVAPATHPGGFFRSTIGKYLGKLNQLEATHK